MSGGRLCEGRVVVVTGAGRGLGRAHALELGRHGARVVVNDLGAGADGRSRAEGPADEVARMVRSAGGEAIVSFEDVADWDGAKRIVDAAVTAWGRLDVLVNNAGFVRDRMLVSTSDWDAVVRVHLKGHFAPTSHAIAHFRERAKAGEKLQGRIINTTSGAGLLGSVGQAAYSAAKAGIAALTLVEATELARYGVTANAIAPSARTRIAWLASVESSDVTGRVFEVSGGAIGLAEGWRVGPSADNSARWDAAELGGIVRDLLARGLAPQKAYGA